MNKLSFRSKALDPGKPMPVYIGDEIPDVPDFSAVNRTVPEMPTGMEKEEETEHHLQRALSAQQVYGTAESLVIPIPDMDIVEDRYRKLYCINKAFKLPKQYIHVQPWIMDQEIPEYDMDSEDEQWLNQQVKNLKMDVQPIKFENMMDRLEKGSGQMVVTLSEAKALLKEDDDLTIAVYDYWLNKRLRLQHSLIPQVRTEKRDGSTTNNPYVAFRRRAEKMQTRKNRKNDETSYQKMLKLRQDLSRAQLILEMLKRREKSKKELLKLIIEIAEKRYELQDWSGKYFEEAKAKKDLTPQLVPINKREWTTVAKHQQQDGMIVQKKREYKKKKPKNTTLQVERITKQLLLHQAKTPIVRLPHTTIDNRLAPDIDGTDDEGILSGSSPSDHEGDSDPDGAYAFRRKHGCSYHAPCCANAGQWPWDQSSFGNKRFKYSVTSLGQNCLGYSRRRVGRGGRVVFDRAFTQWNKTLCSMDWSQDQPVTLDYSNHLKTHNIPHFQPSSCRLQTLSGALDSHESSACPTDGLSSASSSQPRDAVGHVDHPYFASSSTCDSEKRRSFNSSLLPVSSHSAAAAAASSSSSAAAATGLASHLNGSSLFASNGGVQHVLSQNSEVNRRLNELPVVSTASLSNCDDVGLSTLPAASILQLNYPLTNAPRHPALFLNITTAAASTQSLATRSAIPSAAVNNCRLAKPVSYRATTPAIHQSTNSAQKGAVFPRPELSSANHIFLSPLTSNNVSLPEGTTVPTSILNNLVPVLKLPGTVSNRNENKPKDAHESMNHVAKESVVGVEVT